MFPWLLNEAFALASHLENRNWDKFEELLKGWKNSWVNLASPLLIHPPWQDRCDTGLHKVIRGETCGQTGSTALPVPCDHPYWNVSNKPQLACRCQDGAEKFISSCKWKVTEEQHSWQSPCVPSRHDERDVCHTGSACCSSGLHWLYILNLNQPVFLNVGKFPSDILKSSSSRWVTFKVADCADVSWQTGWECVQLEECWGYIFCRVWRFVSMAWVSSLCFLPGKKRYFMQTSPSCSRFLCIRNDLKAEKETMQKTVMHEGY